MNALKKTSAFRFGGHPLGVHRVLEPTQVLPQGAESLDASLPVFQNEILIGVRLLNIDSASFRQLRESCGEDVQLIGERILSITRARGKMHNPVTNSGGMLIGEVLQVGEEASQAFKVGDQIATLVSLTLTPLSLEKIIRVDLVSAQVEVKGYAILFESGVAAKLPEDIPEKIAMAALDVCGAPAWVKKLVQPKDRVLILGAGKSGLLAAFAASERVARGDLWISEVSAEALEKALHSGVKANGILADAQKPVEFLGQLQKSGAPLFDLVVNTCNVPETEMASILATRPGGKILFFNMATQFQRAVLSAEGLGREVQMLMGNGFAEGHAEYALDLVRKHEGLRKWFEDSA